MENINLDWINEIVECFNKLPRTRKNFIEIAGFPSWENVNSNLLAFYFDVENNNDDHGFSTLFLDSLLDLLKSKIGQGKKFNKDIFLEDTFTVEREVVTKENNRIDILIQSNSNLDQNENKNWGLIIENKIYAALYNNLIEYWDSVSCNSNNKIGVILTLYNDEKIHQVINKIKTENNRTDINYYVITHIEFIETVKENLPNYYYDSDDRHLLFLKEYMANIYSLYNNNEVNMAKDNVLKKFHENKKNIEDFLIVDKEISQHVCDSLFRTMEKFGFPPISETYSKTKHFEFNGRIEADYLKKFNDEEKKILQKFRFWFEIDSLKFNSDVYAWFELIVDDDQKCGEKLVNKLDELDLYTDSVIKNIPGSMGKHSQCIYELKFRIDDFLDNPEGFKGKLEEDISNNFFDHENEFIAKAINELNKIIIADSKDSE